MKRLVKILTLLLVCFTAKSQSPVGLPSPSSPTSYYNIGWSKADSGIINVLRDTSVRSRFAGLQIFWQHPGVDSNIWFFDGARYFHYVKSGADVIAALGYTPLQNITGYVQQGSNVTITGVGTLGNPYVISSSGGGPPGGITSLNGLTGSTQTFSVGTTGSDFNISSFGSVHTFNIPTASAFVRGLLGTGDFATFQGKQDALNGTGYVKMSGTTVSYDNTNYYPATNPNSYISRSGVSAAPPLLYNSSTGVFSADTTAGLIHLATQAYVLANSGGGSGTITGAGNLVPLFTTSVAGNTIVFALSNAASNTALTNSTGGSAAPAYGKINNATLSFSSITVSSGDFSGTGTVSLGSSITLNIANNAVTYAKFQTVAPNALVGNATNSTANANAVTAGIGIIIAGGKIAIDTANFKDTIWAVNGLQVIGTGTQDSIGLGGTLLQNTTVTTSSFGFRINFGSDAGYDMMYRDSTTGFWKRFAKGSPGQVLGMPLAGGIGWVNQTGGSGGSSFTNQNITSGSSATGSGSPLIVTINPASVLPTFAFTMPPSPANNDEVIIRAGGTITTGNVVTAFSTVANSGQAMLDPNPQTYMWAAVTTIKFRWASATSKWYREQ